MVKTPGPSPDSEGLDLESDEESIIDIEEHLDWIFGGPEDLHIDFPSRSPEPESDFYLVS